MLYYAHHSQYGMLPSMYTLMYLQTICFTECFIASITAIWNLRRMYSLISFMLTVHLHIIWYINHSPSRFHLQEYTLMYIQNNCVPECSITPITAIWKLPRMYMLTYFQATFDTERFIKLTTQYVHSTLCIPH